MQAITKTRQSIHQLSSQLANQIAAGEVVERPASVVKELLENSLDAGATQIDIDIQAGGTQSIRIRDNGSGIPQDELVLALSPHATSKIESIDDLIHVTSMGFRGEALASIASVSELSLTSSPISTKHEEMAWCIKSKEGQFDLSPAAHPVGTTVEVNNLFNNTPARRQFLKADRTEYKHVEDIIKRIALAHFNVAFNFRHNQRQIFSLPIAVSSESKIQRLTRIINKEFIQAAVELDFENAGLKLKGWIASAEYSRSQSDMQYFFVNGRMVRDKIITHAVRQAFQDTLYPGRFPVYVLQLEIDAEQVDVNVHPTKYEVRFRESRLIHDFIFYSLREALLSEDGGAEQKNNFPQINKYTHQQFPSAIKSSVAESTLGYPSSFQQTTNPADFNKPLGIAVAKIKNDYLVINNQSGVLVLHLSRARQILLEEKIAAKLVEQKTLIAKPVLIPFSISLPLNAEHWLNQKQNKLQTLGFEFAVLGEKDLMVRQVPAILNTENLKQFCQQFVELIIKNEASEISETLISSMLNEKFPDDPGEWNLLLRDLEKLEQLNLDDSDLTHHISEKDLHSWFKK